MGAIGCLASLKASQFTRNLILRSLSPQLTDTHIINRATGLFLLFLKCNVSHMAFVDEQINTALRVLNDKAVYFDVTRILPLPQSTHICKCYCFMATFVPKVG